MNEEVQLSAGPKGGEFVDANGWEVGQERVIDGLRYRRLDTDTAIYCGVAE